MALPKKIAFIHGDSDVIAGSETSLLRIITLLNRDLFSPIVITRREGIYTDLLQENNIAFKIIPLSRFSRRNFVPFFITIIRLAIYFIKNKISLVHVNNIYPTQYAIISSKIARIPCICHPRSTVYNKYDVTSSLIKFTDRVICISEGVKNTILNLGVEQQKLVKIYNSTITSVIADRLELEGKKTKSIYYEFNIPEDTTIIGQFSQIIERKGIKYFLDMAKIIKKRFKKTKFLLVGDQQYDNGRYKKMMEQYCIDIGMEEDVIFTGFRKDVYKIMLQTDIHVLASNAEGLALALIEAAAMKKPVVATNIPGVNEVVKEGETGFLVPASNPAALAEKVMILIKDTNLVKKMGENAKKRFNENFNPDIEIAAIQKLYTELLKLI